MGKSVWTEGISVKAHNALQGNVRTDVLVIGGGLCGILCAYELNRAGVDCLLVEAEEIAGCTTKNTTAKITSQHGLIYDGLLRSKGKSYAAGYLEANQRALEKYRTLSEQYDFDFEEKSAFVYSLRDRARIEREVQTVNTLGFPAEFAENLPLPFPTKGAVCFPHQAQCHPLKLIAQLAEELPIYEHTFVERIEDGMAETAHGSIAAKKIIVTTHFPFLNRHGSYFMKLYQHRSYVLALEHAPEVDGMYLDEAQDGLSFRNAGDLLLLGGGGHRTGKQGGGWRELEEFASSAYPDARITHRWAAQDCMSLDGIPYIGAYAPSTPNLYVASGFNKWGLTSSMAAAMILCDLMQGKQNDFAEIFRPDRRMIKTQMFRNAWTSTVNLLTPSRRRCTHLGCALKWNPQEHTWDCPCHGSRFEKDGTLIDNPAKRDARSCRK